MSQERELKQRRRRRLSLSVRVSLLLMLAALLPLLIVVASSELLARPALISQANTVMESDARSRTQLIDTYFTERMLDAATLSQVPSLQTFMASPPGNQDLATHAIYALVAGSYRDHHYTNWSLFATQGEIRLYYPAPPQAHGQYIVPPAYLQAVTSGKSFISAVYFDPKIKKASVDIYNPIIDTAQKKLLGFVRASLAIDYIWDIVNHDRGANGNGSYAFILDQDGVRIADTNPSRLFSAIAPLSQQVQSLITSEERFGTQQPAQVIPDQTLEKVQQDAHPAQTFQMTPAEQNEAFQVVRLSTKVTPWTYFVLSPVSTVTAVANQQLFITSGIAAAVLLLAAIIGIGIGRRITRPILRSVEYLRGNSEALNILAARQRSAATEQMWVVESSHIGLQSVQYYSDATKVAAHHLSDFGNQLVYHWHQLDEHTAKKALGQMTRTAQYIEKATHYQSTSNQKLATALKVTTQVTEQLATGATSAAEAATQLEQVVNELRAVVGK
jgi:methyl-accepting chemotaxis protein